MSILSAIIQAIAQGLTEFLPVSSSGHLSVIQYFVGSENAGGVVFSLILHLGTLGAVFIAFHKLIGRLIIEFCRMVGQIFTGKFKWKERSPEQNMVIMLLISTALLLPIYFTIGDWIETFSEDGSILLEGICFIITGVVLIIADRCVKGKKKIGDINGKNALVVGAFQCAALFPGISRSGSTISGGLLSGMTRETAVQYSFILGIPAILGGAVSEIGGATKEELAAIGVMPMVLGLIISFVVGIASIYMVRLIVKKEKFTIFSVYLFALGLFCIIMSLVGGTGASNI